MNENTNIADEELALINKLTRRELSADEVYTFSVILCDNETDRDNERFSIQSLETLAQLFVGKTGIFDHDPKSSGQTARIYSTQIEKNPDRKTASGEIYTCVKAKAYLMRTEKNAALIAEIDGGIKKEVSVCCSVKKEICSICGADRKTQSCTHIKGEIYNQKPCVGILTEPLDAYEWSFVAVPAQPAAGVTKSYTADESQTLKSLRRELDGARSETAAAKAEIISEIIGLGQFCIPAYSPETVKTLCKGLSVNELIAFKERTRALASPGKCKSIFCDDEAGGKKEKTNSKFKMKH